MPSISNGGFDIDGHGRKSTDGDGKGKTHRESHHPDLQRKTERNHTGEKNLSLTHTHTDTFSHSTQVLLMKR